MLLFGGRSHLSFKKKIFTRTHSNHRIPINKTFKYSGTRSIFFLHFYPLVFFPSQALNNTGYRFNIRHSLILKTLTFLKTVLIHNFKSL